jgi:hypothetical protein
MAAVTAFALQRVRVDRELQLGEAPLELGETLRQLLGAHAVLARRRVHGLDARFGFPQRRRIQVHAGGVVAQRPRRLARLRLGRLEQLYHRLQSGVVRGKRLQPARHRG